MNRFRHLLAAAVACGCSCPSSPPVEKPPADLAAKGVIIDQPASDGAATGAWVTVSGWADPAKTKAVVVVGAPIGDFYLATGHVGVPTVPVSMRADGRFFAPRVPLQDGTTTITILPLTMGGATVDPLTRTLTVSGADSIPATLVVDPPQPEPGQSAKLRAATADSASLTWDWDFESDGTFDATSAGAQHTWAMPGEYAVTARTRVGDAWVSAWARVTVGRLPAATATSTSVASPSRLFVIPKYAKPPFVVGSDGKLPADVMATRYVAAIDGDAVKVFDVALAPLFTLDGLSSPSAVVGDDQGRLYVADTGHDRIARFTAAGALDTTFATAGSFTGTTDVMLTGPTALAVGPDVVELVLSAGLKVRCSAGGGAPMIDWANVNCSSAQLTDSTSFGALGLTTLTHGVVRPTMLFDSSASELALFVAPPKLIWASTGSYQVDTDVPDVADIALGRTAFTHDLVVVDSVGHILQYRGGRKVASWALDYPATCVAAGPDGQVYVGGTGRLEARAFEVLR